VGGAEELTGMLVRDGLDAVNDFASRIEAMARRALRVLVGQPVAACEEHGRRGVVLGGDELELVPLVVQLLDDGLGDARLESPSHLEGCSVRHGFS